MRAWRKILAPNVHAAEQAPDLRRLDADLAPHGRRVTLADMGFEPSDLWLEPGEDAARRQAREFMTRIGRYKDERDFPARPGVSALSVHLRFGTVSIRELVRLALEHEGEGSEKWVNELIWREFYQSILYHFPQVVERTFQEQYEELEYPGTKEDFDRWCDGQTGYPIVDAAMRCLRETGYMHNRLRMVAASFLTKDLLVDYRWGEAHFARLLLDFELASNNGGWQWAAGTGADPQPYFRIFNPMLQSKKFDPDGAFIRRWVPELSELEGAALHEPWLAPAMELAAAGVELGKSYPAPIVDHYQQRERAIRLLESVRR
jgi:deoxyribodipyrimidine photo-lyase